jgi:hypothetical protein
VTGGCWKFFVFRVLMQIQGDLGERVSILVGDSIGHCERKVHMNMCLILCSYRDRAV